MSVNKLMECLLTDKNPVEGGFCQIRSDKIPASTMLINGLKDDSIAAFAPHKSPLVFLAASTADFCHFCQYCQSVNTTNITLPLPWVEWSVSKEVEV
jgi:hypothetical protein